MTKLRGLTVLTMVMFLVPAMLFAQTETAGKSAAKEECRFQIDKEKSLKIKKLELELKLKNLDLVEKKNSLHDQLGEEMIKDKPSDKEIDRISKEMTEVHSAMMKNRHEHLKAVRQILSAEEFRVFFKHGGSCGGECGMEGGRGMGGMQGMGRHKMGDHKCMGDSGCCEHGKDVKKCAGDSGCCKHAMAAGGCGGAKAPCAAGAGGKKCIEAKECEKEIKKK